MTYKDAHNVWLPILFYIAVIGALYLINTGNTSVRVAGMLGFSIIALFLDYEDLIIFVAIIEPFSIVFKFSNGFSVMPFLFLILFLKSILRRKNRYRVDIIFPLAILIIGGLFVILFRGFGISSFASFYLCFICFLLVIHDDNVNLEYVFNRISILYIISVFIEVLLSAKLTNTVSIITNVSVYNLRNIGFSNEWELGRHLVVAIGFAITNIVKRSKGMVLFVTAIVYFLIKLTSTGLYSGLLAVCIVVLCLPFVYKGSLGRKLFFLGLTIIVSALFLVLIYKYVFIPMYNLRGQFTDNGRYVTWSSYIQDLWENTDIMLFGVGAGCIGDYASSVHRITAHNILIEKLVEFGVFGIFLLVYITVRAYKGYSFRLNYNYHLFPLIAFLGTTITQGVSGSELLFILMMICMIKKNNEYEWTNPKWKGRKVISESN